MLCESFLNRALVSDTEGNVSQMIVHGVASVFCNSTYRGRQYGSRMMSELSGVLRRWQVERKKCVASILYSDIRKSYYADLGWHFYANNIHIEFQPFIAPKPPRATLLQSGDLGQLC